MKFPSGRSTVVFLIWNAVVLAFGLETAFGQEAKTSSEPLLTKLPPGIFVDRTILVPEEDAKVIGSRLGGTITRLSNNFLRVQGRAIQANFIVAADEANAIAIQKSLEKIKRSPFVVRQGAKVVEYVGRDIDEAIAIKTSFELGMVAKPKEIQYRVEAQLALIDKAEYMSCNPLFLAFLGADRDQAAAEQDVAKLSKAFVFGNVLVLRSASQSPVTSITWKEKPVREANGGITTRYEFAAPQQRFGVPFVALALTLDVDDDGLLDTEEVPGSALLQSTQRWPVSDPAVLRLAKQITQEAKTNDQKVKALLQWLAPGKNIKYSGQTGSRYGTEQALKQKFGHCWDFSDIFVTLARASGVPCRQVAGWLFGSSGHVWCEYYSEGKGWQQVDPTGGAILACGIYHLPYFTTEDGEMPIVYTAMPSITIMKVSP